MPKKLSRPAYTRHSSGQARVRISGQAHYLGPYGSPESRQKYDELVAEWLARQDGSRVALTVDDLCLLFLDWAEGYYRHPDGTPTGTIDNVREALRYMVRVHGRARVRDFGPLKLKAVRQAMIDDGRCRTNINRLVHWVRRVFAWAVENEYVPVSIYDALKAVPALKEGRTEAIESDPVEPVDEAIVNATLPHLPGPVAAMVRLQLLTGARPGEVCSMRPGDVTIGTDGVWTYRPRQHKTRHRGKDRRIFIGPEGQKVLRPFLDRDPDAYCFSPADSVAELKAKRRANRRTPVQPSQVDRSKAAPKRKPGDRYGKTAYFRAVERACEAAFGMPGELRNIPAALRNLPTDTPTDVIDAERMRLKEAAAEWRAEHCWSPAQLRHTRATLLREQFGIEAAQLVLGHSDPRVTMIYAERDFAKAAEIMRQIG